MQTIKLGSKGEDVKVLQKILGITTDGIFGTKTESAVKTFQSRNGLVADGIVGAKTWTKLLPTTNGLKKSKRNITEIIVHCSATPEGKDFTVADITRWHKERGFATIGYHYVIYRDGSVHDGRDVDSIGAHCTNHNANSIGVCYIGGMDAANKNVKDTRTVQQTAALVALLKKLRALYPNARIYGHRDFAAKACPSFDAKNEYKNL